MCQLCDPDHIARQVAQNHHLQLAQHFQALATLYLSLGNGELTQEDIHGGEDCGPCQSILDCQQIIPMVVRELVDLW